MEQINLNIMPDGVMPVCHASQFDKNRTIRFNLNQNGSVYTLAGTETITCKVRKPDDTESTINVANTSSSYVDVTFGFSDTDLSGYAMCELKIVNGAQTIGSRNFLLIIEADAYDGSVFEERSASGEIASFETNFIDNLTECIVDIDAVQDLHGYDKPWVGGAGKNKLPNTASTSTIEGVTFTVNDDGSITANGTSTGWTGLTVGTCTLPAGTYKVSSGILNNRYYFEARINGANYNTAYQPVSIPFRLEGPTEVTVKAYVAPNYSINNVTGYPMIIIGSESDLTYEPYSNICPITGFDSGVITVENDQITNTYAVDFGQTVYGGHLNVTTGELTITHGYIASYNGEPINEPWISSIDEYAPNTSPSTGAEVVYPLTTPTTLQLTPTEVRTLLEDNNIFADTGDVVSCKYLVEVT